MDSRPQYLTEKEGQSFGPTICQPTSPAMVSFKGSKKLLRSSRIYKNGGNYANYIRSNGQMTESCWQLPRLSLGDDIFFNSLRCDFWPFAYNHKNQGGKPEDIFSPTDLAEIMGHMGKFIENVIRLTAKTNIMSSATLGYIKKYVGESKIKHFFRNGKLFSLSSKELKPHPHAECFTNERYVKHPQVFQKARDWDQLFSIIKGYHGDSNPCSSAAGCVSIVEGSAEHIMMVEKNEANKEACSILKKSKFDKGEHAMQLHAKAKLEEMGNENVDVNKAISILEKSKFDNGEHALQLHAKAKLEEMGYKNVDVKEAKGILEKSKFDNGEHALQKHAKAKLVEMGYENVM